MNFKTPIWMRVFWDEADGGGGAGGAGADGGGAGGAGGAGDPPASLFSQMSGMFEDPEERTGFEKWSQRYTSDKERAKAFNSMRSEFDKRVKLPDEQAKPEDIDKFWQKLGKPPTPKDYKYEWGDHQMTDLETSRFEAAKEYAHKNNYTQPQFEKMIELYQTFGSQDQEMIEESVARFQDETTQALKKEWGADFEQNVLYAKAAGKHFAPDHEAWTTFVNMPILGEGGKAMRVGDHPVFLQAMAKAGRAFAEDTRVDEQDQSGEAGDLKAQIAAIEQEAIKANKRTSDEPFHSRLEPLYKKLYPKKHKGSVY